VLDEDSDESAREKADAKAQLDQPGRELAAFLEQAGLDDPDARERASTLDLAQRWFEPTDDAGDGLLAEMRERAEQRYGYRGAVEPTGSAE
jgi:hypothetical protein